MESLGTLVLKLGFVEVQGTGLGIIVASAIAAALIVRMYRT